MVDLDSDPTKLIEIVEIGKQLLITRGALTTFSIANDLAKYFAILPAMFAAIYPGLGGLNVMRLALAGLGDPVRGHLQRADHRGADPAGPARRAIQAVGRQVPAAPQPVDLRHRRRSSRRSPGSGSSTWSSDSSRECDMKVLLQADRGRLQAPAGDDGADRDPLPARRVGGRADPRAVGQGRGFYRATGTARPVGSSLIGRRPGGEGPGARPVLPQPPVGGVEGPARPRRPGHLGRLEQGARRQPGTDPALVKERARSLIAKREGVPASTRCRRTRSRRRPRDSIRRSARPTPSCRYRGSRGRPA